MLLKRHHAVYDAIGNLNAHQGVKDFFTKEHFTSIEKEIEEQGVEKMKEFGPVHTGGPAGDFGITTLHKTQGWVVSGYGYGMYTYVHPSELDKQNP